MDIFENSWEDMTVLIGSVGAVVGELPEEWFVLLYTVMVVSYKICESHFHRQQSLSDLQ